MDKLTKEHLSYVTVDALLEEQKNAFSLFASSNRVLIGFNAFGKYVVKTESQEFEFTEPQAAIDKYTELVS